MKLAIRELSDKSILGCRTAVKILKSVKYCILLAAES